MRELQVRNRRCGRAINSERVREIARALLEEELALRAYQLGIQFVSAKKMAEMNWEFLRHKGSTDVITFDYREGYGGRSGVDGFAGLEESEELDLAGEIFISVADALKQAKEFGTSWQEELVRYVVHGVLHLRGYDDLSAGKRKVMKREENRLMRNLGRRFNARKIAR